MADIKISALTDLNAAPAADDKLVIVDNSVSQTKRVDIADLFTNPNVTGTVTADGLTVDGTAKINSSLPNLYMTETDTTDLNTRFALQSGVQYLASVNDALTVTKNRISWDNATGDISFYEDTGTTAKFFWDASAESLGIGTTSPEKLLHLKTSEINTAFARIESTATNSYPTLSLKNDAREYQLTAHGPLGDVFTIYDGTAGSHRLVVDASGNVGIGTSSPIYTAASRTTTTINGASTANLSFGIGGTGYANLYVDALSVEFGSQTSANPVKFTIGGTEKMRIDSSGNLLVGTTSLGGLGVSLSGSGYINASRTSGESGFFNRASTDGNIVSFYKDGSTVGSIGTYSNNPVFSREDSTNGLLISSTAYLARDGSGNVKDGTIDLGASANRFKNLYLSGGVYLGGTGAANLLDDYEEGTFTPVIEGSTTAGTGIYTAQAGYYTKVGNTVVAHITLQWSAHTGTGNIRITGFPFNPASTHYFTPFSNGLNLSAGYRSQGFVASTGLGEIYQTTDSGTTSPVPMDTNAQVAFTLVYRTP